jgi:enoyl-CoA hydratase
MKLVKSNISKNVAVVTLNDPKQRNALSLVMADEIKATLEYLVASPEVGAVVLTGSPPTFSAGVNLNELENATRNSLQRIYESVLAVVRCPLPTIAAINGPAVGAGLNLALACDVRITARSASFESRFIDLALHPGGGQAWMLNRLLGAQGAAATVLYGEALDGETAALRGLAWACVDDDQLMEEAVRLATRAAAAPREVVQRIKATLRRAADGSYLSEAMARDLKWQLWSMEFPEFRARLAPLKRWLSGWKSTA